MQQQRIAIKTIIAVGAAIYFLRCARAPETTVFMHLINS